MTGGPRRLFRQPLVPLVGAADGRWLLPAPLAPLLKPGGHGAIWKLMHDQGVFAWLAGCGRAAALVRQIRRAWRRGPGHRRWRPSGWSAGPLPLRRLLGSRGGGAAFGAARRG